MSLKGVRTLIFTFRINLQNVCEKKILKELKVLCLSIIFFTCNTCSINRGPKRYTPICSGGTFKLSIHKLRTLQTQHLANSAPCKLSTLQTRHPLFDCIYLCLSQHHVNCDCTPSNLGAVLLFFPQPARRCHFRLH